MVFTPPMVDVHLMLLGKAHNFFCSHLDAVNALCTPPGPWKIKAKLQECDAKTLQVMIVSYCFKKGYGYWLNFNQCDFRYNMRGLGARLNKLSTKLSTASVEKSPHGSAPAGFARGATDHFRVDVTVENLKPPD